VISSAYHSASHRSGTAFDVSPDGSLSPARLFIATIQNADGMAMDSGGHLFVATADGVQVFDPSGELWGTIEVPDSRVPANCAFGGDGIS